MADPLQSLLNTLTQAPLTMAAQLQAGVQNAVTSMGNAMQNVSANLQKGQATMVSGLEQAMGTFGQQASKPLVPLHEILQGGFAPQGGFIAEDRGGELRETMDYEPLTDDRRNMGHWFRGSTGFTEVPNTPGMKKRGTPPKTTMY